MPHHKGDSTVRKKKTVSGIRIEKLVRCFKPTVYHRDLSSDILELSRFPIAQVPVHRAMQTDQFSGSAFVFHRHKLERMTRRL